MVSSIGAFSVFDCKIFTNIRITFVSSSNCRLPPTPPPVTPKPLLDCPRSQPKPLSKCPLPALKPEARSCNYNWKKCRCGGKTVKIYNTVRMDCLPGVNVVGKWHKVVLESPCPLNGCMWVKLTI